MNEVFLDTSFAIALSSITDQHHARAVQTDALTADTHFQQAGFRALLKN